MKYYSENQKTSGYYDKCMGKNEYTQHYKLSTYFTFWQKIRSLINQTEKVMEVGCGTGQFANYLMDENCIYVCGFDFSRTAIEIAFNRSAKHPLHRPDKFICACAINPKTWESLSEFDTVICLETLEHIEQDIELVENIHAGKRVIFSVPDYYSEGHVRTFNDIGDVYNRYSKYFDVKMMDTYTFPSGSKIFVVDGIKKPLNILK